MTPKTVIELLRCTHGERGRLLVMKRTEPREIPRARLLELDVVADDPNDVGLLLERVFEVGRGHGVKVYCGMAGKRGDGGRVWRAVEKKAAWCGQSCPRLWRYF